MLRHADVQSALLGPALLIFSILQNLATDTEANGTGQQLLSVQYLQCCSGPPLKAWSMQEPAPRKVHRPHQRSLQSRGPQSWQRSAPGPALLMWQAVVVKRGQQVQVQVQVQVQGQVPGPGTPAGS